MTVTKDGIEQQRRECEAMDIIDNLRSEYAIGSSDFIRE